MDIQDIKKSNAYYERLFSEQKSFELPNLDVNNVLFRASQVGDLMGIKGLGKTGEKRARHTYLSYKYGREKEFKSKYTDKGIAVEDHIIGMLSQIDNVEYTKNEVRINNEFFTGECDIITDNKVIDVKASYDVFTFDDSCCDYSSNYEYQLRVYMALYGVKTAELVYMLVDAPYSVILKALEVESYKHGGETPEYIQVSIIKNLVFTQENFTRFVNLQVLGGDKITDALIDTFVPIPIKERVVRYQFTHDENIYSSMVDRVKLARHYLKTHYKL